MARLLFSQSARFFSRASFFCLAACSDPSLRAPSLGHEDAGWHVDDDDAGELSPEGGLHDAALPSRPDGAAQPQIATDASEPTGDAGEDADVPPEPWDPGPFPWELVPEDEVLATCRLDPEALKQADALLNTPWAVVRYGKLCHQFGAEGMAPRHAWSTTKSLGALVTGMVAYETRDLVRKGRKTGPLNDTDRVDHWLDAFTYNQDAQIAHVLAMVAHSPSLAPNEREMFYDMVGTTQINSLSEVLNLAIQQDTARFGDNLHDFVQRFLFDKLGLQNSDWSGQMPAKVFGFSWLTDVYDMAKVGLLMLQKGEFRGERLLSKDWIYRMTHPAFEDANTGYGYLTWVNSASNYTLGGTQFAEGLPPGPAMPGPCAPVSIYKEHPHGLSSSTDCNYDEPYSCTQEYDVGVWQAVGMFGQVIQGHPGLDLVVVGMDLTPPGTDPNAPGKLWDALRPAVILADPTHQGDEAAFCTAYSQNRYAPDLVLP